MPYSYNGWYASPNPADFGGLAALVVAGESFAPGVRRGDVHTVLGYVADQMHRRVEPVVRADWHPADDWGYSYRPNVNNPSSLSCHASGTAIDYNATRHPNGSRGTFSAAQVRNIRKILAEVDGVVDWGGDFTGTPDEMHFEISGNAATVARVAARIGDEPAYLQWSQADRDAAHRDRWTWNTGNRWAAEADGSPLDEPAYVSLSSLERRGYTHVTNAKAEILAKLAAALDAVAGAPSPDLDVRAALSAALAEPVTVPVRYKVGRHG